MPWVWRTRLGPHVGKRPPLGSLIPVDLPPASDPQAQHPCSPPRSGLLHCPLSSSSAGVSEVPVPRLPGTRSPDTLWTPVSQPPSFWASWSPLASSSPLLDPLPAWPLPYACLDPSPSIYLSAPLSVPVSVALSPSVHLSVTPSALPCSPLLPLILARSFPICPPSPPSPQGPLPLDTD